MKNTYKNIKFRIFKILEIAEKGDAISRSIDIFLISLIILNVFASIICTVHSIYDPYKDLFHSFEAFSIIIFTVEYVLRVHTCTVIKTFRGSFWGRIKYMLTPLAMVDLIAIVPFYIPMITNVDLLFLRSLRLIRTFRLFKIARYSASTKTFARVFKKEKEAILITISICTILIIISSSLMYFVEHLAQPTKFSSIPATLWWSMETITTVGYGDMVPSTIIGKLLASLIAFLGVGVMALPTAILSVGFISEIKNEKKKICPHCNKELS